MPSALIDTDFSENAHPCTPRSVAKPALKARGLATFSEKWGYAHNTYNPSDTDTYVVRPLC